MKNKFRQIRVSIRLKWLCLISISIFVLLGIFAALIYTSVDDALIQNERNNVRDTVNAVNNRFGIYHDDLTKDQVKNRLLPVGNADEIETVPKQAEAFYHDSLTKQLAQNGLSIVIYDTGHQPIFRFGKINPKFQEPGRKNKIIEKKKNESSYLETLAPIQSQNDRVIGFVKVDNNMKNYHRVFRRLNNRMIFLLIIAALVSLLLGFLLTDKLIFRINQINKTIDTINSDPDSKARIPEQKYANDEISDLAVKFNHMLDRMQNYTNQQKKFVSDVSHELRTPVAVIEGYLKMLQRWGKDDPQILNEAIDSSVSEVDNMKNLIQEMLDLTRAEQIETNYSNKTCDANEVVQQAYNDFKMVHTDFQINFDDTVPKHTKVQIYRNHLMQILVVLLDNAVKYSKDRKEINLSVSTEDHMLAIAVQDFGVGISQKNIKKIFNRFYRVDESRSHESGGNGLGLAIAKRIVELYKGNIKVESSLGSGTIFRVNIPLVGKKKLLGKN